MIQFKQYPSIGSASDEAWMERVRSAVTPETLFAVQEKVDGVNVSIFTDGQTVRMARQAALLEPGEPFFGWEAVLDRYEWPVCHIFNRLSLVYPEMTAVAVYGELFGGAYPHPDICNAPGREPVRKGVWYCPWVDFYAFDIYVFTGEGSGFSLPVIDAKILFAAAGFLYAWNRFVGTLDDCLAYPHVFPTAIPRELGLPPIDNNLCEGIVIKPLDPVILQDGSRVALKVKNPESLLTAT